MIKSLTFAMLGPRLSSVWVLEIQEFLGFSYLDVFIVTCGHFEEVKLKKNPENM